MAGIMAETESMAEAIRLIRASRRIAALSGAGISTEAGVPDFRGPSGLWRDPGLLDRLSLTGFRKDPAVFYASSLDLFATISGAEPTSAHRMLARLESLGKLDAVVTQNIDGLHQKAGSKKVFEVHGTYRTGHCPECHKSFKMEPFYREMERGELKVPRCEKCSVPIKPDIVLFEELLPYPAWKGAVESVSDCDLLLVLGSSLVIYPAAELPSIALAHSARLLIVNLQDTPYDNLGLVVRDKLGHFAQAVLSALGT
jgi:NAD-dependent deacetylase